MVLVQLVQRDRHTQIKFLASLQSRPQGSCPCFEHEKFKFQGGLQRHERRFGLHEVRQWPRENNFFIDLATRERKSLLDSNEASDDRSVEGAKSESGKNATETLCIFLVSGRVAGDKAKGKLAHRMPQVCSLDGQWPERGLFTASNRARRTIAD